jgi:hypothetical protein
VPEPCGEEVDIETEAIARAAEILGLARRLRHIRTMDPDEADALLARRRGQVAQWRVFAERHYRECKAIGALDERMLDEVAALRRALRKEGGAGGVIRNDGG